MLPICSASEYQPPRAVGATLKTSHQKVMQACSAKGNQSDGQRSRSQQNVKPPAPVTKKRPRIDAAVCPFSMWARPVSIAHAEAAVQSGHPRRARAPRWARGKAVATGRPAAVGTATGGETAPVVAGGAAVGPPAEEEEPADAEG